MRVEASDVVLGGVSSEVFNSCRDSKQVNQGWTYLPPTPAPVSLFCFCAHLLCVSPVPKCYHTPCECHVMRDGLSEYPRPWWKHGAEEMLRETME